MCRISDYVFKLKTRKLIFILIVLIMTSFYIRNGDFDTALKTLMFSKEFDADFYTTYSLLGLAYANKGQLNEAQRNLEKAVSLNPGDVFAKRYLEFLKSQGK